jgi:glycosyltransferase involved in cell wall biosynthesis
MKFDLVSVIINCYNSEKFLKSTLDSLVLQTYGNWELIFYDNCSTDDSFKIFKSYKDKRFKYFKSKKFESLGVARKNAFLKAKGKYVVFLDSDDLWLKNKLDTQLKYFNDKKVGFVISNSIFLREKNEKNYFPKKKTFSKRVFYDLIENYFISFDSIIFKSSYIKKLDHSLDKRFDIIHDMDLIIRLSRICEMRYAPYALSKWRIRNDSFSFNNFGKIINEKKIFIKKISKIYKNDIKFSKSKKIFMDTLYRQEILYLLTKKDYLNVFYLFKKLKFNLKNFMLFLIIFLPFKKFIYNKFLKIKF